MKFTHAWETVFMVEIIMNAGVPLFINANGFFQKNLPDDKGKNPSKNATSVKPASCF